MIYTMKQCALNVSQSVRSLWCFVSIHLPQKSALFSYGTGKSVRMTKMEGLP